PDPPDRRHAGRYGRGLSHHPWRAGGLWRGSGRQGRDPGAEQDRRPDARGPRGEGGGAGGGRRSSALSGVRRLGRGRDRAAARRLGRGEEDPRRGLGRGRTRHPRNAGRLAAL
ncbi:hypothetical protein LTR94_033505, partial [Friedmanniomyces endolithicus]